MTPSLPLATLGIAAPPLPYSTGGAELLPGPSALLPTLITRTASGATTAVVLIGLLRRDDTWPLATRTFTATTALVAQALRGEDWLGAAGPAEFAVLLAGGVDAAERLADRLTGQVLTLGIAGLTAAAGVAAVEPGVPAPELLRRATLSLTTARSLGSGSVVRYAGER